MLNGITHHVCAVDGGGTGCRALIAQPDGSVLARGSGGPANFTTNPRQAIQSVCDAVDAAVQSLQPPPELKTLVAHVGLAGIMSANDENDLAGRLPFGTCTVSDDRMTSALGVLGTRDGAVLAIGTGSFVAVRRGADVAFWGGWGFAVGDQASGAWLGRALLEHGLCATEGLVPHSDLSRAVLARFNDAPVDIARFAAKATPKDFADYAPMVVSAAAAGDEAGHAIMSRGADYLNVVLETAGIGRGDAICLTGGVGPHYAPFLAEPYRRNLQPAAGVALDGALHLARQNLHAVETSA